MKSILIVVQTLFLAWLGWALMSDRPFWETLVAAYIAVSAAQFYHYACGRPWWVDKGFDAYDMGVAAFLVLCWLRGAVS